MRDQSHAASPGEEMEPIPIEDLDEVELLLTELEISQAKGNLILCVVASPAYRDKIIETVKGRFPSRVQAVEKADNLISDLKNIQAKKDEILIWMLPEMLDNDILNALNNFRELFYDAGVPSVVFMTPAGRDDMIWKALDFWRYRGGYHIVNGDEHGQSFQALEALSTPLNFSYNSKEDLLRHKRINEYLLDKIQNKNDKERILSEIGTVHLLLSEPRKAIEYYEQALDILREIADKRGEGNVLWNMSLAQDQLGDRTQAIDCARAALKIQEDIEDPRREKTKRKLQEWDRQNQSQ